MTSAGCNNTIAGYNGFASGTDVFGYNYKPGEYTKFHRKNPLPQLIGSEANSCISSRGIKIFAFSNNRDQSKINFHMSSYDLYTPGWATTADTEFKGQDENVFVGGEFVRRAHRRHPDHRRSVHAVSGGANLATLLRVVCSVVLGASAVIAVDAGVAPLSLTCGDRQDPLGIDEPRPGLGWQLTTTDPATRGLRQSAYQIQVASSAAALADGRGDLWDSGKVKDAATARIAYAGSALHTSQRVVWHVRAWDGHGDVSAWSPAATWTMGVMDPADWQAKWIRSPGDEPESQLLRREFIVKPGLVRALIHCCGLGQYELRANGGKVGTAMLTPGWTDYRRTCLYDTYDLTSQLAVGHNAIGLILGNGFNFIAQSKDRYNKITNNLVRQKAIAQLRLEYADGSIESVLTDGSWQTHSSPVTYANVYGGEDYDARLEVGGWDTAIGVMPGWTAAEATTPAPGALRGLSRAGLAIRISATLTPVAERDLGQGVTVYDLGQNASLMPRLTVSGAAGSSVRIIPSELVKADGDIDDTVCGGSSFCTYILAGGGIETWSPRFYYRGARYLRVECRAAAGSAELPLVSSIVGDVLHADAAAAGTFTCSDELLNRIHTLVRWAQRSNLMHVFTDCPQREKLGWLEQTHLNGPALRYEFAVDRLFGKTIDDIAEAQQANGLVPNIAPEYTVFGSMGDIQFRESPEWGSAFILVAWQQYQFTGDSEPFARHYAGMKRYLDYLGTYAAKDGIVHLPGSLGDWYDIGPNPPWKSQLTPTDLTATAIYHEDAQVMARIAALLGRPADATAFTALAAATNAAFTRAYLRPARDGYAGGSQTANAMALECGLAASNVQPAVVRELIADVTRNHLTAGDVGYRYLLRALADHGHSDLVYALTTQSDRPGYGMQLQRGATSLTEAWDANRGSSQNHFMLGQINEWLYHDLAGIQPDPTAPGFRASIIKPAIVGGLSEVSATYASACGPLTSHWQRSGKVLRLACTIPANTTATIHVPAAPATVVREGKVAATAAPGVRLLRREGDAAVFLVGSGTYVFTSSLP